MGTTPTYGLPYPELTDQANVPVDMRELAEAVDTAVGVGIGASRASRTKGVGQALTVASTWYVLTYDVDDGGAKDITYSGGVFTVGKAGLYQINLAQHFQGASANMAIRVTVNAVVVHLSQIPAGGSAVTLTAARVWPFTAGSTVKVEANCSATGSTAYGNATTRYSYFDITRLSA